MVEERAKSLLISFFERDYGHLPDGNELPGVGKVGDIRHACAGYKKNASIYPKVDDMDSRSSSS
jgi:hypothetical protein